MGRKPKMPPPADDITPLPDLTGASAQQARFDAIKKLMNNRGRSSTLKTFYKKRTGDDVSGRLSDVPSGGREGTEIVRG